MRGLLVAAAAAAILPHGLWGQVVCNAAAGSTPPMRLEGTTEQSGDVVLTCTGGVPTTTGSPVPLVDVTVTFNRTVSSRGIAGGHTEALLILDEEAGFFPCLAGSGTCGNLGTGTGIGSYGLGAGANKNLFRTVAIVGTTGLTWRIPLDPPGVNGIRTIRLTNLRVQGDGAGNVLATVSTAPAVTILNGTLVVGAVQAGLSRAVRNAANTAAAPPGGNVVNTTGGPGALVRVATLRFGELFASAFRQRTLAVPDSPDEEPAVPADQNTFGPRLTETDFFDSAVDDLFGSPHGLADHGTRFRALFSGVPAGVQLYAGVYNDGLFSSVEWLRAITANASCAGLFQAAPASITGPPALIEIPLTGGQGSACWEVLRTNANAVGNFDVGVYASYPANLSAPAFTVRMELAPLSAAAGVSVTAPVPRFREDTTTLNVALFQGAAPSTVSCTAAATPVSLRAQGLAEKVADILISCTGGTPTAAGQPLPQFNLSVGTTPAVNITSRLLAGSFTEALLLLDEPQPFAQFPCEQASNVCGGFGNGVGSGYYGGGVQSPGAPNNRNVYQGVLSAVNMITFQGIPFDPPGPGATRLFRITNVRVNATQLAGGVVSLAVSTTGLPGGVQITNPIQAVGMAGNPLTALVRDASGAVSPAGIDVPTAAPGVSVRIGTLRFAENQPAAFLQRTQFSSGDPDAAPPVGAQNTPGQTSGSETGFFNPNFPLIVPRGNLGLAGLADNATRLRAIFTDIPNGVTLQVGIYNETTQPPANAPELIRLTGSGPDGAGPFTAVPGTANLAQIPVVGTTATAVWEVLRTNPAAQGSFDVAVFASFPAGVNGGIRVQMDLAPASVQGLAAAADPLPRFVAGTAQNFANLGDFRPEPPPRPSLNVSPLKLSFTAPTGGTAPPQRIQVEGQVQELEFDTSWGNRFPMRVEPAGGITPRTLTLTPSAGTLRVGTYADFLTVSAPRATNNPVLVEVVLTVVGQLRLLSLSPASTAPGGSGFTLGATGENVPANSILLWNNEPLNTRTQGDQLFAEVPARLYAFPGQALIAIRAPDGTISNALPFLIGRIEITAIEPDSVTATRPGFNLTITGTGFAAGATVQAGTTSLTPSSTTATRIVVTVPADLVAQPGLVPVKVTNPGGAMSNEVNLRVRPAPVITQLDPAAVIDGAGAFRLTVLGRNFTSGSTVNLNGRAFSTAFGDEGRMFADVPADALAGRDAAGVTVVTADGVSSNTVTLPVRARPVVSGNPPIQAGDSGATVVLSGSGFAPGTMIECRAAGGAPLAVSPSEVTLTTIRVTLPAACLAAEGTSTLRVIPPNGPPSGDIPITILPPPRIVRLARPSVDAASGPQRISVEGTGFLAGSSILVGGTELPAQLNEGRLEGEVPAGLLARPGTANVQVRGPGGSLSNVAALAVTAPPLPPSTVGAPATSTSRQQFAVAIQPGSAYPLPLTGVLTLTFQPDGTSPDDPAIAFSSGSRVFTFSLAAGQNTPPAPPQVQTGSTAGVIILTLRYTLAEDPGATPANETVQRVTIPRAVPVMTALECTRRTGALTVVASGVSNTRELRQGIFDFQAAAGETLAGGNFTVDVTRLSDGYFVRSTPGGLFRYEQDFSIQGGAASTAVASVTVTLVNSVGRSEPRSAQCQ